MKFQDSLNFSFYFSIVLLNFDMIMGWDENVDLDERSDDSKTKQEINFFRTIGTISFDNLEITEMYRNLTAEAKTPGCPGRCQTPVVIWMISSLIKCFSLEKMDCPTGLVCCAQEKIDPVIDPVSESDSIPALEIDEKTRLSVAEAKYKVGHKKEKQKPLKYEFKYNNQDEINFFAQLDGGNGEIDQFNFPFEQSIPLDSEEIV